MCLLLLDVSAVGVSSSQPVFGLDASNNINGIHTSVITTVTLCVIIDNFDMCMKMFQIRTC